MIKYEDLPHIDFSDVATGEKLLRITPGEMLREEFMEPLGLSASRLAREIGVPANRITAILNGTRGISAVTAILLGRRFGTTPEFWMNLQMAYDLAEARDRLGAAA